MVTKLVFLSCYRCYSDFVFVCLIPAFIGTNQCSLSLKRYFRGFCAFSLRLQLVTANPHSYTVWFCWRFLPIFTLRWIFISLLMLTAFKKPFEVICWSLIWAIINKLKQSNFIPSHCYGMEHFE